MTNHSESIIPQMTDTIPSLAKIDSRLLRVGG